MTSEPADPAVWYEIGLQDRQAGNEIPGVTREDFNREIESEEVAAKCWRAYRDGFEGKPYGVSS